MFILLQVLLAAIVIGLPAAGLAQFRDKGDHVEVKKGTRLCSSVAGRSKGDFESASNILEGHEPHTCQWHADRFRARP